MPSMSTKTMVRLDEPMGCVVLWLISSVLTSGWMNGNQIRRPIVSNTRSARDDAARFPIGPRAGDVAAGD